jgi:hypothetical protein
VSQSQSILRHSAGQAPARPPASQHESRTSPDAQNR